MKHEKTILIVLVVLVAVALVWSVTSMATGRAKQDYHGQNYQEALANQNPNDVCATPAGYTDEQWRTHISHHPDMYSQCF